MTFKVKLDPNVYGENYTGKVFSMEAKDGVIEGNKYIDFQFLKKKLSGLGIIEPMTANENLKELMIIRLGGIGDGFFITPLVKAIKAKHPGCRITFCGSEKVCDVLLHNPNVDRMVTLINHVDIHRYFDQYDDIYDLSGSIEWNHRGEMVNAYELTCLNYGLESESYEPELFLQDHEIAWAKAYMSQFKDDRPKIGIHMDSSTPLRSMPKAKTIKLINALSQFADVYKFGINSYGSPALTTCESCQNEETIFLSDGISQIKAKCRKCSAENTINRDLTPLNYTPLIGLSIRQNFSLINHMDMMITVDSGFMHATGALHKPLLALFASFDGSLRTKHFKNTITLQKNRFCGPCHLHSGSCKQMVNTEIAPCMDMFNIDEILEKTQEILSTTKPFSSTHVNAPEMHLDRLKCPLCDSDQYESVARKADRLFALCKQCKGIFNMGRKYDIPYDSTEYHKIFNSPTYSLGCIQTAIQDANMAEKILGSKGKVIEIGCSSLHRLEGWNQAGWDVSGIEVAHESFKDSPYSFKDKISVVDFEEIKTPFFPDYDVVYLNNVWEHFYHPIKETEKLVQMMKPGGLLFIIGPCADKMGKHGYTQSAHVNTLYPSEHWYIPSKQSFEILSTRFGLKLVGYKESLALDDSLAILQKID